MEETVRHGLDAHNDAKDGMDVVEVGEFNPFAQDGPSKGVVDVVCLGEEHHHVERIVEEYRASGQCQQDHGDPILGANSLAGTDALFDAVGTSIREGLLGNLFRRLHHSKGRGEEYLQEADEEADGTEHVDRVPPPEPQAADWCCCIATTACDIKEEASLTTILLVVVVELHGAVALVTSTEDAMAELE